jgi:hypothetical protein
MGRERVYQWASMRLAVRSWSIDREGPQMKLRSVMLFAAGVATGLAIARKLAEDDEAIVHGPQQARTTNPMMRAISGRTAMLSDRATVRSLDVIRRARVAIRDRMAEQGFDEAAWS